MFKIQGKIVVKETGTGVPGLIVHAFDYDVSRTSSQTSKSPEELFDKSLPYDSLGSVMTTNDGSFVVAFGEQDFNISDGKDLRPEVFLLVTRPEDADEKAPDLNAITLYFSRAIRYKAGKTESYHIRIPEEMLNRFGIHYNGTEDLMAKGGSFPATHLLEQFNKRADSKKKLKEGIRKIQETVQQKVNSDFSAFTLSSLADGVKNSKYYLKPGESLQEKQSALVVEKLNDLSEKGSQKTMKIRFTEPQLRDLGLWSDGGPVDGTIPMSTVSAAVQTNTLQRMTIQSCAGTFTEEDLATPPATVHTPSNGHHVEGSFATIQTQIERQLASSTSPETALKYEKVIDADYKNDKVCETVNLFSLCGGPADVTSYHDFHSVQIAFEHVWTEVFDNELEGLGKKLYTEVVKKESGFDETVGSIFLPRESSVFISPFLFTPGIAQSLLSFDIFTRPINTLNDLSELLSDLAPVTGSNSYLQSLVQQLQQRLAEKYKFTVFAPDSVNYGVVFTYRQKWEPVNYQVGKLISSLPLAPKEVRKYSSKRVINKSRNEKYLDDREFKGKSESTSTSRAESEIIKRATNNTSFGINTNASVNMEMFEAGVETNLSNTSEKFSQDTKKNFREAVMNAAEEYRKQNKTEIEFGWKDEMTSESSGEISNPNDEITVTYLFYELQRQYDISEQLHRIQPVVLVANEVPTPNEIDNDWLITHAWILKRVILDESFIPTLNQLSSSTIGDNLAIQNLQEVMKKQQLIVDAYTAQITIKTQTLTALYNRLQAIAELPDPDTTVMDQFDFVRSIFDPIGSLLSGGAGALAGDTGPTQAERINEYLQNTIERNEKENKELAAQLLREQSSLTQITEKYNKELQSYFDRQAAIMQLRIHIKENILYYMQAIWDYEPPDQRYFRLYNLEIDWFERDAPEASVRVRRREDPFHPRIVPYDTFEFEAPLIPSIRTRGVKRKLVEVADLDNLLGYKGNYMLFPVKEICYLHEFMMQEFIDNSTGGITDPDEFANYTTQDLIDYLKCVRGTHPEIYEQEKDHVIAMINARLQSPRKEKERVVIPTNSVFIEALPGKHPVMEDFKLAHRALDVKKVQAEVRHAELENLRLAARLMAGEREDPDIEKVVVHNN